MDANVTPSSSAPASNVAPDVKVPQVPPSGDNTASAAPSKPAEVKTDAKDLSKAEKEVIRKIKIGDIEYDETTLSQMIEKSKGADKKFLEAAKARKEAIKFFKLAKENPEELLSKSGKDPKQWAYEKVAKDLQDKLRDPREVELERANEELKRFREAEESRKQKVESERQEREAKAMEAKFHSEIIEALELTPSLPKNGFTVAQIAKYIDTVRDKTGVLLSAKEVVKVVEKDIQGTVKGILSGADAEKLISLIGEDGVKAIQKHYLNKLKDPLKNGSGAAEPVTDDKPKQKKWKSSHEYWKTIDDAAKRERGEQ
jgi:hypothetical protein